MPLTPPAPTKIAVVTGASRGLGHAIARCLLDRGWTVAGLARGPMPTLAGERFIECCADLADAGAAVRALESVLTPERLARAGDLWLINNAGVVTPIGPSGHLDAAAIATAVALNLAAPMALTNAFLGLTEATPAARRIANISSGAAHTPYRGWSTYCATKAGLDHFTRCVALEQAAAPNPARIAAIAPGVVDTDMQKQLRSVGDEAFPNRAKFVEMHAAGQLASADATAAALVAYFDSPDFGDPPVVDLRTLRATPRPSLTDGSSP